MLTYLNNTIKTSVRKLVEFLLRSGDITTGSGLIADPEAMQEGSRLHKKIQRAQRATYQSEVSLKMCWNQDRYDLILEGRADGIDRISLEEENEMMLQEDTVVQDEITKDAESLILIDEIKCVYRDVKNIEEAEELHLAQAKCYAYMYGKDKEISEILVRITYCNIETEAKKYFVVCYDMNQLEEWFLGLIDQYTMWANYYIEARTARNQSISNMSFPFIYRKGQKSMIAMVYRGVKEKKHIFLQAPTGIGKTISTLYPVLKILGEGEAEKIFYLTAKTITRTVAEDTIHLLRQQGMHLKAVTITAKEKICILEKVECNPLICERARGHYDRINQALYSLLTEQENIDRNTILEYSERFHVCPYELSFEAAEWADVIICDYNYVFDPHVNRKSLFGEKNGKQNILLIDEAHNLLDRARDMYSAILNKNDFLVVKKIFKEKSKYILKKLQNCNSEMLKLRHLIKDNATLPNSTCVELTEGIDGLYYPLFRLLGPLEEYLKDHPEMPEREEVVEFYFHVRHFFMIMDSMEDGYLIYGENAGKDTKIRLFCVDPSSRLEEYLERSRAGIFFSATLLPIPYYKQLLGGNHGIDAFSIPSPFDTERRLLAIAGDVTSRYSRRGEREYRKMVRYLEQTVEEKTGNYMIFFPSYDMLNEVYELAMEGTLSLVCEIMRQEPSMGEREREHFLERFQENANRPLIGFCVLGSIFSEGIDLTGSRLLGVLIVGNGLPQICNEREMIRTYFDRRGKKGYDYAYRYPGMNKVLQAAGRVIRTAQDIGIILLMDDRFLQRENQVLLPEEWDSFYEVNLQNYGQALHHFWENYKDEI
ncbi:MAG: ATP-dependent DNA helicase [Lachnospiraceae bacterium]|nr:ATP-dependent DNA helicase [Lachnospiraceae bacterium]